ncbi:MAG: hypothetical protein ABIJ09_13640 [Pseudomonadota bacterium]
MKRTSLLAAFLGVAMLLSARAQARPWQGITPGKSTKPEVAKAFGKPHRTLSKAGKCNELHNYQGEQAIRGTKQTNVCFDSAGVVLEISVFPDRSLTRELVEEAYGSKYQKKLTDEFREYYFYKDQGMAVFWDKDGKTVHSLLFTVEKGGDSGKP